MGKRSNFPRRKHDDYRTPYEAALPLKPFLTKVATFAEPCAADGRLIRWIESFGPLCIHSGDIKTGTDALTDPELEKQVVCAIITNPPYAWEVLEAMLERFLSIAPTWLLLEADFAYRRDTAAMMRRCTDIVPVGRVRWFPETKNDSYDNFAWCRFSACHDDGPKLHVLQEIDKASARASTLAKTGGAYV
jgi:hypothetical protein